MDFHEISIYERLGVIKKFIFLFGYDFLEEYCDI